MSVTSPMSTTTRAASAGVVAMAVLLLLGATERLSGLDAYSIPFVATAAVVAMAPTAPLARPRAIALSYPAATTTALFVTEVAGPSAFAATVAAAVSITVIVLLGVPHAPAVAAAAVIGLTDPGFVYLLDPLAPALAIVVATPLLAGHLLPTFAYPATWD